MSDDASDEMLRPPGRGKTREREYSGVQPFFSLRFRKRGRSVSRIVVVRTSARNSVDPLELELYFGVG